MNKTNGIDKNILLEQYKLYVEMADRISQRRQSANNYFLSINILLSSFIYYLKESRYRFDDGVWIIFCAGFLVCLIWYCLIRSYKKMNNGKFKVIHEMEQMLDYQPYNREWEKLGKGKDKSIYHLFTDIEIYVPWIFGALYALYALYVFFSLNL